ncbi:hypothetical protein UFOVP597_38 [uncultured Caudovirales phage]|uniref:Uncharacterized protein n=1 Tax=uncultured Caudovirales phage TaxID=2100421 RepID=A0A6J5MYC2_9CAUD|nr:hypothetical protein UFOVP597_38 [uncultured Caudovirales phage]
MSSYKKVFWTMKDGNKIDIDLMDINHLRNCLKMVIRQIEMNQIQKEIKRREDFLNGEIAIQMYEQMIIEEFGSDEEYEFFNSGL